MHLQTQHQPTGDEALEQLSKSFQGNNELSFLILEEQVEDRARFTHCVFRLIGLLLIHTL